MHEKTTRLEEWFDIKDNRHLFALGKFLDSGEWPVNFIPKDVLVGYQSVEAVCKELAKLMIKINTSLIKGK